MSNNHVSRAPVSVLLWRRKVSILALSLVAALAALVICLAVSPTYQATATVLVTLPPSTSGGVTSESVTASSDLAGQYAQLAGLGPTLRAAAQALGIAPSRLDGTISAGVVASQNLVAINAQSGSKADALSRANAVAGALVSEINRTNARALAAYASDITRSLGSTNQQIQALRLNIARNAGHAAIVDADSTLLSSLLIQRQQAQSELAQEAANEPTVTVASGAQSASQTQPKTLLYTLITFIVALFAFGQIAVIFDRGREPSLPPRL